MKPIKPITVLGAGKPKLAAPKSSANAAYIFIPLVIGLPIMAYFLAQVNHWPVAQFTPLLFIATGLGFAAIFGVMAQAQREEQRAKRAAKKAKLKAAAEAAAKI